MGERALRIAIVGTGAIGGYLGTRLAKSGASVTAIARGTTSAALRAHGWRIETDGVLVSAPAHVAPDDAEAGIQDAVIVAVKAPAMADVAPRVAAMLGPDTAVVTPTAVKSRLFSRRNTSSTAYDARERPGTMR